MSVPGVTALLRPGLLEGCGVAIAGDGSDDGAIAAALRELGARLEPLAAAQLADEEEGAAWARRRAPLRALIIDTRPAFGNGGLDGLNGALELAWRASRAVATGALIEQGQPARLVFVAPAPSAGEHAEAARAGLENLARTLAVEWARFQVTATSIAPGAVTGEPELATMACYLSSAAGAYFSGCALTLGS